MTVIWDMVHVVWRAKHHGVKEYLMAFPEHDLAAAWMAEQPKSYPFGSVGDIVMNAFGRWEYGIESIPAQHFAPRIPEAS